MITTLTTPKTIDERTLDTALERAVSHELRTLEVPYDALHRARVFRVLTTIAGRQVARIPRGQPLETGKKR